MRVCVVSGCGGDGGGERVCDERVCMMRGCLMSVSWLCDE